MTDNRIQVFDVAMTLARRTCSFDVRKSTSSQRSGGCRRQDRLHRIERDSPWENGYIERFVLVRRRQKGDRVRSRRRPTGLLLSGAQTANV